MALFSFTNFATLGCLMYMAHMVLHFYRLFTPDLCSADEGRCLPPFIEPTSDGLFPLLQLRVYSANAKGNLLDLMATVENLQLADASQMKVNVTLPPATLRNGTLFVACYLLPHGYNDQNPNTGAWSVQQFGALTTYQVAESAAFNLIGDSTGETSSDAVQKNNNKKSEKLVSHLRSVIPLTASYEAPNFAASKLPSEFRHIIHTQRKGNFEKYLPLFYLDELSYRQKDLVEIKPEVKSMEVTIDYRPSSIGKLRLLIQTANSLHALKGMGFTDKDVDEVKGIFVDTNLYLLSITVLVSALHLLFDVLSFKNDIQFWRGRKTMVGLSTKALLWRCFSYTVIFFYLMDQKTSLLVLIPSGVSVLIELWKLTKAFKVSFSFSGGLRFGAQSAKEQETGDFDGQAMKYLAWLLVPLCVGGAAYSLAYVPHRSWRSWILESMANGVYAFGFLFMLPQLFVNYKLKSVAHLPWRAFMYKAFNTFIDDLFAFIITMPTAHRVACFRDDVVFVIYLYQRYLYPVDRSRVNEYGESGESEATTTAAAQPIADKETKKTQ